MDCRSIKELIATDYLDGQLHESVSRQVRAHIDACPECRAYEDAVRRTSVEPFKNVPSVTPPDFIWARIKDALQTERRQQRLGIVLHPRPVYAAIAIALCVITATTMAVRWNSQMQMNSYLQEQAEFLSSLDNGVDTFEEYSL